MSTQQIVPLEAISQRIFIVRGMKVMLDADLAGLYQVMTRDLNKAVRRNTDRFPEDFMFKLTKEEAANLMFQFGTSSLESSETKSANLRSQIATSSWGGTRKLPYVFTEHGVAMLSSVLHSPRAVQVNISIIRAFVRLREILASNKELAYKIEEIEREQKTQNRHINAIYRILDKLIAEPVKPKGKMGFTVEPTQ